MSFDVAVGGRSNLRAVTATIPSIAVGYVLIMSVLGTLAMQYADRLWVLAEPILVDEEERTTAAD